MNAALPEGVQQAFDAYPLDDQPRSGWRRRHKDRAGGVAARGGFGVEHHAGEGRS